MGDRPAASSTRLVPLTARERGLRRLLGDVQLFSQHLLGTPLRPYQLEPARAMYPLCRAGISPQRTSEDLPQPDVPMTGRKRDDPSRRSRSSVSFSRPKKR